MASWKTALFSSILIYMILMTVVGTALTAFVILETIYTPRERDSVLPPASRVDLAPELVPYTMFSPPTNTTITDVQMPAEPGDTSPPTIEINKHGFRYGPLNREKPADTTRYFLLGGSVVFYGHTNQTTISGYLEANLSQQGMVQVVNAGGTGFISNQELVLLVTRIIDFAPDGVIVFDGFNDMLVPTAYEQRLGYPFKFKTLETAWYQSTAVLRKISRLPLREHLLAGSHFLRQFSPHWSYVNFLGQEEDMIARQEATMPSEADMVVNLINNWRKMARFLMAHQVGGLFILQPYNTNEIGDAYKPQYDLVEETIPLLNDEFAGVSPAIRFVSFRDAMADTMDLFWDSVHTYDEGNRLYAERIRDEISRAW